MIRVTRHVRTGPAEEIGQIPNDGYPWWPADLIVPPGRQAYPGQAGFICTEPGLHLLFAMDGATFDGGGRIVWTRDWNNDPEKVCALIAAFAWSASIGLDDEGLTDAQKTTKAREKPLAMRCGPTCTWVKGVLASAPIGLASRIVNALTAEEPNGYDDGHVMLEVNICGAWVLFDVANDCTYRNCGDLLSYADVIERGVDCTDVDQLAVTERDPGGGWNGSSPNMAITVMQQMQGEIDAWKRRIYQLPGVTEASGLTYWYLPAGLEDRGAWLLTQSPAYRVLSKADWLARFY